MWAQDGASPGHACCYLRMTTVLPETVDARLVDRHRAEARFHDHKYATGESFPRHYRHNPTIPVLNRMLSLLPPDLTGRRVLEYGCGTGWVTVQLAKRGASVCAFDISPEAVAQSRDALRSAGMLDRCDIDLMAGERLAYPDESFDLAVGFAILHHLELGPALAELRRVLKPGGRALFAEPLSSNPIIRLYRRLTPKYRTADEAPIALGPFARRVDGFKRWSHHDQLLLASGALAFAYLPGCSRLVEPLQRWLSRVDDVLLRWMPRAGRWAWYSVLVLEK